MRAAALLALAIVGLPPASVAAIHTCIDAQGRTVFRDSACPRGERAGSPTPAKATKGSRPPPKRDTAREPAQAAEIDRRQVERILDRLDKAMAKRNAKAVTALLSGDAQVQWQLPGQVPPQRAMDRAAYAEYLRQVFARADYVYQSESARVSLSKRKARATATRTLREAVLVNGRLQMAEVREKITLEPDGRKLMVRSLRREAQLADAR